MQKKENHNICNWKRGECKIVRNKFWKYLLQNYNRKDQEHKAGRNAVTANVWKSQDWNQGLLTQYAKLSHEESFGFEWEKLLEVRKTS